VYRLLTPEQLERLHFPSAQTALRRIRRLEEAGLVLRRRSDAVPTQLVSLTPLGMAKLVGSEPSGAGAAPASRRPAALPGAYFLRHQLEVTDFRIALALAVERRREVELLGELADTDRTALAPGAQPRALLSELVTLGGERGERLSHTADLAFAMRRGERQALFLVEIDRGTEVVGDPKRGVGLFVRFYLRALVAGAFDGLRARFGLPGSLRGFRVLVVTQSAARVEAIRARWGPMPMEQEMAKRFVWLTTRDALRSANLLEHGWVSLDPRDYSQYAVAPRREEARA
jgi:DNA-binding MarR family transcriptional regulator